MQENRWFTITGGNVELANKKFTKIQNDFCLKFNWLTKVEEVNLTIKRCTKVEEVYLTIKNLVEFAV